MALFNFGKKKEEEKKAPACACSCGCPTSEAEEITKDCCSEAKDGNCCCSSEYSTPTKKEVNVEYLFLDLNTCDRCIGTDEVLEDVLNDITPTLELAGYTVSYKKIEISTPELAEKYRFLSSPTIRVNGKDICETVMESDCDCCGDIAGVSVDCRVFEYEGKTYEVPTKRMLADAILKAFYAPTACSCTTYQIPENLKRFFEGKKNNESNCSCGCSFSCPTSEVDEIANDCSSEAKDGICCIKVLGAGCKSCHELYENAKQAVKDMGLSIEVEYITDMQKVMEYGVMSMPALVVNEKVVAMGKVLKANEVVALLQKLERQE